MWFITEKDEQRLEGNKILKINSKNPTLFVRRAHQLLEILQPGGLFCPIHLLSLEGISLIINMYDKIIVRDLGSIERWEMRRLKVEILFYLKHYIDEAKCLIYAKLDNRRQWEV